MYFFKFQTGPAVVVAATTAGNVQVSQPPGLTTTTPVSKRMNENC